MESIANLILPKPSGFVKQKSVAFPDIGAEQHVPRYEVAEEFFLNDWMETPVIRLKLREAADRL